MADDLQQRASQPSYHSGLPNLCETAIDQNSFNLASPVKAAHRSRITRPQKKAGEAVTASRNGISSNYGTGLET